MAKILCVCLLCLSSATPLTRKEKKVSKRVEEAEALEISSDGGLLSESQKYKQMVEENAQLKEIMRDWVEKAAMEKESFARLEHAKKEATEAMEVAKAKIAHGKFQASSNPPCSVNKAWKCQGPNLKKGPCRNGPNGEKLKRWTKLQCQTFDECQQACRDANCAGFNWWGRKGGCRMYYTDVPLHDLPECDQPDTEVGAMCQKLTRWMTVGGQPDCTCSDARARFSALDVSAIGAKLVHPDDANLEGCEGPTDKNRCPDEEDLEEEEEQ